MGYHLSHAVFPASLKEAEFFCLFISLHHNYLDKWIVMCDSYNKVPALIFPRGI